MKKPLNLLLLCLAILLGACNESEEPKPEYKPGQIGIWLNTDVTINEAFTVINGYNLPIAELSEVYFNSALPVDSIPYMIRELQTKPYFQYPEGRIFSGFFPESQTTVSVFMDCINMTRSNQEDWLQTMVKLELTDSGVLGTHVTVTVTPGHEEEWVTILTENAAVSHAYRVPKYTHHH